MFCKQERQESCHTTKDLNGTESRIANRTIPRIAGLESPEILQREANKLSRIAASSRGKSIQNRHPNRSLPMRKSDLGIARFESHDSQEKASAEIRGEFFRTNSWVNFAADFLVDLFGPFSLEKKQEEKSTQKIHGNFQIRIREFRGQNPHCKDPALTILNRSILDSESPIQCH